MEWIEKKHVQLKFYFLKNRKICNWPESICCFCRHLPLNIQPTILKFIIIYLIFIDLCISFIYVSISTCSHMCIWGYSPGPSSTVTSIIFFPTSKHQNSPVTSLTNIPKGIPHRCFQIIGRLENITIIKTLKEGEWFCKVKGRGTTVQMLGKFLDNFMTQDKMSVKVLQFYQKWHRMCKKQ